MAAIDLDAPLRFLSRAFDAGDWAAIVLKSYERNFVVQRVGPVSWFQSHRFQRRLRAMNVRKFNVYVLRGQRHRPLEAHTDT
jgi:hypothetical protein